MKVFNMIFVSILFILLVACNNLDDEPEITLEKYKKLEEGMSYKDVKTIIGNGEKLEDASKMDSLEKYYWIEEDDYFIEVTFYNRELSAKHQNGLD